MKERIYKVLLGRYQNQMEEALLKIDALLEGNILPGHEDVIGSVDKLLDKAGHAKEKMAILRQYYGTNQAKKCDTRGIAQVSQRPLKVSQKGSSLECF